MVWFPAAEDSKTERTEEALYVLETGLIEPANLLSEGNAPVVTHALYRALNLRSRTSEGAGTVKMSGLKQTLHPAAAAGNLFGVDEDACGGRIWKIRV